ncbi:leucine-rich repeat transmembrane neuronal protein 3-like [Lethenteron reissneri]|uniref:leucine-rich repeat transmembrane neuronal protein 3-like n=1 Tax=Lethenteron reissneri TaxID=7753 RepID=UPI002AB7A68C|nr:leucine-rich repeat transmembrane neuronal protein 3-like [Lethenteron reissneri]
MGLRVFRLWIGPFAVLARSLLLIALHSGECACPRICRCEGKFVYCESMALREIPMNITTGSLGLSLRYNSLKSLPENHFSGLKQLTWLYLDHNHIQLVAEGAFIGARRLKELTLSSNKLIRLPNATFHPLVNMRSLDISFNQLQMLEAGQFRGLRKLQYLHMRSNQLRTVPVRIFQDCRSIELLDLGYNRLRVLARNAFTGLGRLTELHLEHNQFAKLNLAHFPRLISLRTLYLQWNRISVLMQGMAWTWSSLQTLDLSGNEIQLIGPGFFQGLSKLHNLRLDSNRLAAVSSETMSAWTGLSSLNLAGNSWQCNQNICSIANWLNSFQGTQEGVMRCGSPQNFLGQSIIDVAFKDGICRTSTVSSAEIPKVSTTITLPPQTNRAATNEPGNTKTTISTPIPTSASPLPSQSWETGSDSEHTSLYKILAGSVALVLSVLVMLLVVYVTWKRYPASLGEQLQPQGSLAGQEQREQHQQHQTLQARRGRRPARKIEGKATRQHDGAILAQEYYVDYKPSNSEAGDLLGNGNAAFMMQSMGNRDCQLPLAPNPPTVFGYTEPPPVPARQRAVRFCDVHQQFELQERMQPSLPPPPLPLPPQPKHLQGQHHSQNPQVHGGSQRQEGLDFGTSTSQQHGFPHQHVGIATVMPPLVPQHYSPEMLPYR